MPSKSTETAASQHQPITPYHRHASFSLDPPSKLSGMLKYWGPGLILTASVVGSGELIATTGLGAKVGYLALWLIIISCVIKVALQLVIGRYAISSGETTLQIFDSLPGPRFRVSWTVWLWLVMTIMTSFQLGAMLGGVGMVLNILMPQFSITMWALVIAGITVLLLVGGRYTSIEKISIAMVAAFTLTTIICVVLIQQTPYHYTIADLISGLKFELPSGGVAIALAVFGITGIGSSEIIYYPYWCLEKGYARAVGLPENSEIWYSRARGWIRTMNWDAFLSMIIYTVLTLAFYILGAAVLHSQGLVPEGMEMIKILSQMYTDVLGVGAFYLFLAGAFFALFSTMFVSVAAIARLTTDCFQLMDIAKIKSSADWRKWVRWLIILQPPLHFLLFAFFKTPLWMVIVGGTAQTLMLPIIVFAAMYLRYRKFDIKLMPSKFLDVLLWGSSIAILAVAVYGLLARFGISF